MSESYQLIGIGRDRAFEIMLGMREGYGAQREDIVHDSIDVIAAHHDWQITHSQIQGIVVTECFLSYGWPEGEYIHSANEPACLVSGNINILYDYDLTDMQGQERIVSLAAHLADALRQTRVYVRYNGYSLVLHREGSVTPTGEEVSASAAEEATRDARITAKIVEICEECGEPLDNGSGHGPGRCVDPDDPGGLGD